jgi:hypothetical protein
MTDLKSREARLFFEAGKNRDGYFTAAEFMEQVSKAVDILERKTKNMAIGLFMFDNAPSHQKRADDALSARKMPKGLRPDWRHRKDGPRMRSGWWINALGVRHEQAFYFPNDHPDHPGWFKGMEVIIRERGLWPSSGRLLAQCEGFKCKEGATACCCRRLLFNQQDFVQQKSSVQELVESRGHLCDYYPKYHCELNFIEMVWGAVKSRYRVTKRTHTMAEMRDNVRACLDDINLVSVRRWVCLCQLNYFVCTDKCGFRYANRSARFMSGYHQGLGGEHAMWANKKYHSHRSLPPEMVALIKQESQFNARVGQV